MTDDKQDSSVVAWRFNDAFNPSREPLFTDKPYVAEVWGSAHGTVTPLSPASGLTAMKAELEEAKRALNKYAYERDKAREERDAAEARSEAFWKARLEAAEQERDELREALNLAAINRATEPSNGGTA